MPKKSLHIPAELFRAATVIEERSGEKTSKRVSISSDVPYLRYDWYDDEEYYEVLSHAPGDIKDDRLKAGLPMLFNHSRNEHLGRATQFNNDGHRMDVGMLDDLIWSESTNAQTRKKDVEKGALVGTSVGYRIIDEGECIGALDGKPVYKFKWEPFEFSFCTIEADITVGAGRQRAKDGEAKLIEVPISIKKSVDDESNLGETRSQETTMHPIPSVRQHFRNADQGGASGGVAEPPKVDEKAIRANALKAYHAACERIRKHIASLAPDGTKDARKLAWQKAAQKVAEKYFAQDEPSFPEFLDESNKSFPTDEQFVTGSGIEVVGDRPQRALSIGAQFVQSKDFKERAAQTGRRRSISVETDMSMLGIRGKVQLAQRAGFNSSDLTAINIAPQQTMIALGMERLTIMDLISPGTTSAAAIPYPKENSQGTLDGVAVTAGQPRAGNVGERGVKPTWEPDITTDTANVKKIAVITKVPDEFIADFPGFQSYIDARLPAMVDFQAENQILYGDGVGNNIKGILTNAGVLTRAYATNWFTTIRKAITDIEATAFFSVDGIAMHPYDWEVASLEVDTNGQPYAGGPFYIPYGNGVFMELRTFWGKPVIVTTAVTVTQPVVGCWKLGAQYFMREGMRLETTNSNEDDFKRNLIAVRAEERLALATYRPACFLEVTGGPART